MTQVASQRNVSGSPRQGESFGVRGHRIRDVARTDERRREILGGAGRAFARHGYDAANMDEIAREAGLAKGHIYHYFLGKEEIFTEIRISATGAAVEQLAAIVDAGLDDPEATLRRAIAALMANTLDRYHRYSNVLADPASLRQENRERIRALQRRYEAMFLSILKAGIKKGIFVRCDPKLAMFVILRAVNGVGIWYREGGRWKPKWITEQITEQLVRSVLA